MNTPAARFRALGLRASSMLALGDSEANPEKTMQLLLSQFRTSVSAVSLYTRSGNSNILIREACATKPGTLAADLPAASLAANTMPRVVGVSHRSGWRDVLLSFQSGHICIGAIVISTTGQWSPAWCKNITGLHAGLALGVQNFWLQQQLKRKAGITQAVTQLSSDLQENEISEQMMLQFTKKAVELVGFTRATLLLYEEDGLTVRSKHSFVVGAEPTVSVNSTPLCLPVQCGQRQLGALLLETSGAHAVPHDEMSIVLNLICQAARALSTTRQLENLRQVARNDDLTGLFRPGYFFERVKVELAKQAERGGSAGVLLIDIDYFKKVNDTFGHPGGDAVLVQVANLVRQSLRSGDIACRLGGDEFLVLLPGAKAAEVLGLANRLTKLFNERSFILPDGRQVKATISIGAALYPDDAEQWPQLFRKADNELYAAKSKGKGRAMPVAPVNCN